MTRQDVKSLKFERMDSLISTVTKITHHEAHSRSIVGRRHERFLVIRNKVEIIIGIKLGDVRRRRKRVGVVVDEPTCDIGVEGRGDMIKENLWGFLSVSN